LRRPASDMVSSLLRIQHPQYYLHLEHTGESFDEPAIRAALSLPEQLVARALARRRLTSALPSRDHRASSLLRIQHPQYYLHLEHTGESFDERVCFEVRLDVRPLTARAVSRTRARPAPTDISSAEPGPQSQGDDLRAIWSAASSVSSILSTTYTWNTPARASTSASVLRRRRSEPPSHCQSS
jgi:hypothetical protein